MGRKFCFKFLGSFLLVFLLIMNIILLSVFTSSVYSFPTSNSMHNHSLNPNNLLEPEDVIYSCQDLIVVDDFVLADFGYGVDYLDISTPSRPKVSHYEFDIGEHMKAYTNYDNNILFGLGDSAYNYTIMKIDLDVDPSTFSEIGSLYGMFHDMSLTNDTLCIFSTDFSYWSSDFLIYNTTDFDNLTLLGNTTIISDTSGYPQFIVQEDFVYFTSYSENLSIYQINSSYQLSYIQKYSFPYLLKSIYFYENYLFICNRFGFQVFDYSNPAILSFVTHYNISSAQSIRISDDIAYLTTSDSFIILDLNNIMDPQILDQYIIGDLEYAEMWKIELSENLAIILTEEYRVFDYPGLFGGYMYIFDVSSPLEIERLYPLRIPKRSSWEKLIVSLIVVGSVIVPILVIGSIVVFVQSARKRKKQH